MTDIGDDVAVATTIRVDGDLTDPTTVALTVTAPDGTTTSPTVTNPSVGRYEAVVLVDSAGRWRYEWTATGPAGVEFGQFDVDASPPPPDRLGPLAGPDDLADRLGRALTDAEASRAAALLADASALVRAYTRQTFDLTLGDEVVLRPIGTVVRLPQRPVIRVVSVSGIGPAPYPEVVLSCWMWDGLDKVDVDGIGAGVVLNLPEWWGEGWGTNTYRVVYDHGYLATPPDVVAVVCAMANRVLLAPSPVEGMASETIGQYRYQMGGGTPGSTARLTSLDERALDAYRRTASTIQTRT